DRLLRPGNSDQSQRATSVRQQAHRPPQVGGLRADREGSRGAGSAIREEKPPSGSGRQRSCGQGTGEDRRAEGPDRTVVRKDFGDDQETSVGFWQHRLKYQDAARLSRCRIASARLSPVGLAHSARIPQKLWKLLQAKRLGSVAEGVRRVWMKIDQHR